ncbi:MAG: YlmH/Sll1252 family protein [Clostridia bacterium]|nr:YlmH/Sll1252 family protein [Clostridia bacterium]
MTENELTVSRALDKMRECNDKYVITHTAFLDLAQKSTVEAAAKKSGAGYEFFGGYGDCERTVCVFLPDYIDSAARYFSENPDESPLALLVCGLPKDAPALTHRDYLGSLMGAGIKRETVGDIIVFDGGADIIILREIGEYLMSNLDRIGRVSVRPTVRELSELHVPRQSAETMRGSVASMRLDGVVAEIFRMSREKTAEAITSGLVFVNDEQIFKVDHRVPQGAKVVLRGHGKAVIRDADGKTRSGRTALIYDRYV